MSIYSFIKDKVISAGAFIKATVSNPRQFLYKYQTLFALGFSLALFLSGYGGLYALTIGSITGFIAGQMLTIKLEKMVKKAALQGNTDKIRNLVRFLGIDVNGVSSPLCYAASNGHTNTVRVLINELGANPQGTAYYRYSPIAAAARSNQPTMIRLLVNEFEVNVDSKLYFGEVNNNAYTPLQYAASLGNVNAINTLIELDADLKAITPETGKTLLHLAASNDHKAAVRVLAKAGVNLDANDKFGCTALHNATVKTITSTAKALIKLGANKAINEHGQVVQVPLKSNESFDESLVENISRSSPVQYCPYHQRLRTLNSDELERISSNHNNKESVCSVRLT